MFDDVLIESAGKDKTKGRGVTTAISAVVHIIIIGLVILAAKHIKEHPEEITKPIRAFMVSAPPPPPPPPPPPAAGSSTPKPHIETPKVEPQPTFHQPTEIPKEVPQTAQTETSSSSA